MKMIKLTISFVLAALSSANAQPMSSQIQHQSAPTITQIKAPMAPAPIIKYGPKRTDFHSFSQMHSMNLAMLGLVKTGYYTQLQQSEPECHGATYKNQSHCKLRSYK